MKAHIKMIRNRQGAVKWAVWRDRNLVDFALPTVIRETLPEAWEAHCNYVRRNRNV